jgi:ubiquinone/menaquinone biosynthesis C-methylase UbiE
MFSGSMDWGDTTDMRPESGAQIIAKYDQLPIKDDVYDMVIADPPYTCGFANEWIEHPKDLPKPKRILFEAARVVKPGGLIAILHVIVIPAYKDAFVERVALHPILCGPNNAIRVLNVFRRKKEEELTEAEKFRRIQMDLSNIEVSPETIRQGAELHRELSHVSFEQMHRPFTI